MNAPLSADDRARRERLFLTHLDWIDRTIRHLTRRAGFRDEDADDAASFVRARLIEEDYRIFGQFRGGSLITTYLVAVISNIVRDYRVKLWGRWRPSAAARRAGHVAVLLERLMYRDGLNVHEAVQSLLARPDVGMTERQLHQLAATLPDRTPARETTLRDGLAAPGADPDAAIDSPVAEQVGAALADVLASLDDEDSVIVQLLYVHGATVAEVARALGLEQKPLYRRVNRIHGQLRRALESRGIDGSVVREMIENATVAGHELAGVLDGAVARRSRMHGE